MQDNHIKLPPWSKKRRIFTTIVLTGFILVTSGFIGVGLYQTGINSGYIKPPFTKKSLLESLLGDVQFIRAVKHAAQLKECINQENKIRFTYEAPLHLTQSNDCTALVAIHPTGATITIQLKKESVPRDILVGLLSKEFNTVQTDILSGTAYETSVLTGKINSIETTIYVIRVDEDTSWTILYTPISSVINGNVLELVESFRLI
jgi:hypothetical protein